MKRDTLNDLSKSLIDGAEHDCAEQDPGLCDSAGMVLVGDVYALRVSQGTMTSVIDFPSFADEDDGLAPFIR
jgi:hypothetical protein